MILNIFLFDAGIFTNHFNNLSDFDFEFSQGRVIESQYGLEYVSVESLCMRYCVRIFLSGY